MKNKTKLLVIVSILTACAFGVTYQQNQYSVTASERLRNNAQYNRNYVSIFTDFGLPVVAARFQGRAEAMEEIADLIDAGALSVERTESAIEP